jgi:hypothetical protein
MNPTAPIDPLGILKFVAIQFLISTSPATGEWGKQPPTILDVGWQR